MRVKRVASDDVHLGFEELLFAAWTTQSAQLRVYPKLDEPQSVKYPQKTRAKEGDVK
jgi:hypothetical protein